MELFVVPVKRGEYALYSERAAQAVTGDATVARGLRGWLWSGFDMMLRIADAGADDSPGLAGHAGTSPSRFQRRLAQWVSARLMVQLPLWNLREASDVVAVHPTDLSFPDARHAINRVLQRELRRHRILLIVFTVAFVVSGTVAIVPGPNLIAYYFAFRVVGHWLSVAGATRGLRHIAWSGKPSPLLQQLRGLLDADRATRDDGVRAIGSQLGLRHLSRFLARVSG